jgi:spermidine synthase
VVWTSLIGVILAALSAGYYAGGRRADAHASEKEFVRIVFVAGLLILYAAIGKTAILGAIVAHVRFIHPAAVLGAVLLFAPASVALGMISPYAVKLRLRDVAHGGRTAGNLSALSTIGSIAGTFLAGFFLIAFLGSTETLYALACVLLALALVLRGGGAGGTALLAVAVVYAGLTGRVAQAERAAGYVEADTPYQHVTIFPSVWKDGRPVRMLATELFGVQSAMYLDGHPEEPVFDYMKMYGLIDHFHPHPKNALLVGGAAFSYPKTFLAGHPEADLDVVEIDPGMTELAREFFSLQDDPRLRIHEEDARMFFNRMPPGRYDAVFIDAFEESLAPPPQLTTVEAVRKIRDGLAPDGVVLMNIAGALEGQDGRFFRAEYATYKNVFPQVYAFRAHPDSPAGQVQSIVLVALKDPAPDALTDGRPEQDAMLNRLWREPALDMPVLTDDYAPVERYMRGLTRVMP